MSYAAGQCLSSSLGSRAAAFSFLDTIDEQFGHSRVSCSRYYCQASLHPAPVFIPASAFHVRIPCPHPHPSLSRCVVLCALNVPSTLSALLPSSHLFIPQKSSLTLLAQCLVHTCIPVPPNHHQHHHHPRHRHHHPLGLSSLVSVPVPPSSLFSCTNVVPSRLFGSCVAEYQNGKPQKSNRQTRRRRRTRTMRRRRACVVCTCIVYVLCSRSRSRKTRKNQSQRPVVCISIVSYYQTYRECEVVASAGLRVVTGAGLGFCWYVNVARISTCSPIVRIHQVLSDEHCIGRPAGAWRRRPIALRLSDFRCSMWRVPQGYRSAGGGAPVGMGARR